MHFEQTFGIYQLSLFSAAEPRDPRLDSAQPRRLHYGGPPDPLRERFIAPARLQPGGHVSWVPPGITPRSRPLLSFSSWVAADRSSLRRTAGTPPSAHS